MTHMYSSVEYIYYIKSLCRGLLRICCLGELRLDLGMDDLRAPLELSARGLAQLRLLLPLRGRGLKLFALLELVRGAVHARPRL